MPLRDHFRAPLDDVTAWEGFHAGWPMVIVQQLNTRLPQGFVASPRAHLGSHAEVYIATFENVDRGTSSNNAESAEGGVATAVWSPAQPTLAVEAELPDPDEFAVRIYDEQRGRTLVAAIEIVSPANKDRAEHRRLFVGKCAALLQEGVAVTIVDLVTVREFNLYAKLLEFIGQADPSLTPEPSVLYAVSCRWQRGERTNRFEAWNQSLVLGHPLPTLPLWLTDELAVPLELEASYERACADLRIP